MGNLGNKHNIISSVNDSQSEAEPNRERERGLHQEQTEEQDTGIGGEEVDHHITGDELVNNHQNNHNQVHAEEFMQVVRINQNLHRQIFGLEHQFNANLLRLREMQDSATDMNRRLDKVLKYSRDLLDHSVVSGCPGLGPAQVKFVRKRLKKIWNKASRVF